MLIRVRMMEAVELRKNVAQEMVVTDTRVLKRLAFLVCARGKDHDIL